MSEFGDAVAAALTEEWQPTSAIAARCPTRGHSTARTFRGHVYHHLTRLVRTGVAECRLAPSDEPHCSAVKEWRLRT